MKIRETIAQHQDILSLRNTIKELFVEICRNSEALEAMNVFSDGGSDAVLKLAFIALELRDDKKEPDNQR